MSISPAQADHHLRICHGSGGYPPYHYYDEGTTSGPMKGVTIDIITRMFDHMKRDVSINAVPWRRCLVGARDDSVFDVIADGSFNEERMKYFYYSSVFYKFTPIAVYRPENPAIPRKILTAKDLKKLKVCASRSTNLKAYGLTVDDIAGEAVDVPSGLAMVVQSRCDVYVHLREIIEGFYFIDTDNKLPGGLATQQLTFVPKVSYHLLISKKAENAAQLTIDINQQLLVMKTEGELDRILRKYTREVAGVEIFRWKLNR